MTDEERQAIIATCRRIAASKHYKRTNGCVTASGAILTGTDHYGEAIRYRYPDERGGGRTSTPVVMGDGALPDYRHGATIGLLDEMIAKAHGVEAVSVRNLGIGQGWVVMAEPWSEKHARGLGFGPTAIDARIAALNAEVQP